MPSSDLPNVLFIHGLWLHPQSWRPWVDLFEKNGYPSLAPGWPGVADTVEAARAHPDDVANRGIEEITDHYRRWISGLDRPPVVIGHSFGGLIAQKLLGEELAARGHRDRRRPDQGRPAAAALGAALDVAGVQEPGQQASGRVPDQ